MLGVGKERTIIFVISEDKWSKLRRFKTITNERVKVRENADDLQ